MKYFVDEIKGNYGILLPIQSKKLRLYHHFITLKCNPIGGSFFAVKHKQSTLGLFYVFSVWYMYVVRDLVIKVRTNYVGQVYY